MLGLEIRDPNHVEGGGSVKGIGLLPVVTVFDSEKHRTQVCGTFREIKGTLKKLTGVSFFGYEIHHGNTVCVKDCAAVGELSDGRLDGAQCGNVYGTYVHGVFDERAAAVIVETILEAKGLVLEQEEDYDRAAYRQRQYDLLADSLRSNLDMDRVYRILNRRI